MTFQLKSPAEIEAIITGPDFAEIVTTRKRQLAAQLTSVANELDAVLPVLLGQIANSTEASFLRALVSAGSVSTGGSGSGNSNALHTNAELTGLTGGGSSNLDGLATAGLPGYYTLLVMTFSGAAFVRLEMDADPANGAEVIVPPDHNEITNARSWRVRL